MDIGEWGGVVGDSEFPEGNSDKIGRFCAKRSFACRPQKIVDFFRLICYNKVYGDMAQLVERCVRIAKVSGSTPLISTSIKVLWDFFLFCFFLIIIFLLQKLAIFILITYQYVVEF